MSGPDAEDDLDSETYYRKAKLLDVGDKLLERYYHSVTRVIRPQLFYAWLRAKAVLTHSDQEEVENKFITTILKAGHLVDIVKTKGANGFVAFMEVIEYEYPELFTTMTSLEPRLPPPNFFPSSGSIIRNRPSVMKNNADFIIRLAREIVENKERFDKLQQLITQMQTERQQEADEHQMLLTELRDAREHNEEILAEKERLSEELKKVKQERDVYTKECTELRRQKDSYMDECNRLRFSSCQLLQSAAGDITPSDGQQLKRCRKQCQELREQLTSFKSSFHSNLNSGKPTTELIALRSEIGEWEKKDHLWTDEKCSMSEKIRELESKLQLSQQTSDMCLMSVEDVKKERDQVLKQMNELQARYDEELKKNSQLSSECHHYVDKFRRMEETMQNLYREIDQLKLLRQKQRRMPYDRPGPVCIHPIRPTDGDISNVVYEDMVVESYTGSLGDTTPMARSHSEDTPLYTRPDGRAYHMPTAASQPEFRRYKQQPPSPGACHVFSRNTPIILFSPPHILQPLMDYLKQFYDTCPYELTKPGESCKIDTIHEISSPDDSKCQLLTVEALRKRVEEQRPVPIILTVPASSIKAINLLDINVVIVMVKLHERNGRPSSVTKEDEDLIEMCQPGGNRYEQVEVDAQLAGDIPRLGEAVRAYVDRLTSRQ